MKHTGKSNTIRWSIENAKSKNVTNGPKATEEVKKVKGSTVEYCRMA
jgi:hypothetical protein